MKRFTPTELLAIDEAKYIRIRSGDHRTIWVWIYVVGNRVFVRSWNDKPTGWYRAFLKEPNGFLEVARKEVPIKAKRVRGSKLLLAVEAAMSEKYTTKANLKYVKGFKTAKRRAATLELIPV